MGRKKKEDMTFKDPAMDRAIAESSQSVANMPLNTYEDYRIHNRAVRKENSKLGYQRFPIKQCPIDLHPKERIIFNRNDQPSNPQPVYLSNDRIHFDETLIPGKQYDLPRVVLDFLASKGRPIWEWITKPDGTTETRVVRKEPRFSMQTVYSDND